MKRKWKYVGAILGTLIGLVCAWNIQQFGEFWVSSPVPFAIIGYAAGALVDDGKIA